MVEWRVRKVEVCKYTAFSILDESEQQDHERGQKSQRRYINR
jgi:hypothetical protein